MHIALVLFFIINIVHSIEALITCPTGWILYTYSGISKCYKFYLDSFSSWTNCKNTCTNTPGGSMLCPGTTAENYMINGFDGKPNKWIGYYATSACDQKGSYKWVDTCIAKPDINYSFWGNGQPDANSGCSVYVWNQDSQGGKWDNVPDTSQVYCACEITPLICPAGWILYTDSDSGISKCYKFYLDSTSSWTNCKNTCTQITPGGSMLCPGTDTLNQWIDAYGGNKNKWIGYYATSATDQKSSYKWVDTCSPQPEIEYSYWGKGQPDGGQGYVYIWTTNDHKWDNNIDTEPGVYCACEISTSTLAPTFSPSTVAPTFSPSTEAPTFSPSTEAPTFSPSTVAPTTVPTTAVPSTLVPTSVQLPECPNGWTLHCNCEWTSGPEKKNIEHDAVSVDTKSEVSSNDAGIGFNNQFFMGIFVGAIGSLSLYLYTRSKEQIMHRSEYIPINDRESG